MADLATQIRDYVETTAAPVEIEELTLDVDRLVTPARPLRLRTGLAVAFATAAVIVVLIGGATAWFRSGDDAPVVTEPPTISVTTAAAVEPDREPPLEATALLPVPSPVTWEEVSVTWGNPALYGGFMNAVTTGGPGLVAVGAGYTDTTAFFDDAQQEAGSVPSGPLIGAVWVSENGVEWTRVAIDPQDLGGAAEQHELLDVASNGSLIVAVGAEGSGSDDGGNAIDGTAWISEDGVSWRRIADPDGILGGPGNQVIEAVVAAGRGFVAVGSDDDQAAVWTSVDGLSWSRARVDAAAEGESWARVRDVVAAGPGFVAVGAVGSPDDYDDAAAAVWTSTDGDMWSRVSHDASVFDEPAEVGDRGWFEMLSVDVVGEHIVAVGMTGVGSSQRAIWVSDDGVVWERVLQGEADWGLGSRNDPLYSIVTDGERFSAVGIVTRALKFGPQGTGTALQGAPGQEMTDAVVFGDHFVAVGHAVGMTTGAVWVGTWTE